jgi:hypothetical protein
MLPPTGTNSVAFLPGGVVVVEDDGAVVVGDVVEGANVSFDEPLHAANATVASARATAKAGRRGRDLRARSATAGTRGMVRA